MNEKFEDIWTRTVNINDRFWFGWRGVNPVFTTNALAGEVGEACNITKKLSGGGSNIKLLNDEFISELKHEIADIMVYTILLSETIGMRYEEFKKEVNGKLDIVEQRMSTIAKKDYFPDLGIERCDLCGGPLKGKDSGLAHIEVERFRLCYNCASEIHREYDSEYPPELDD
jgi:NTP pyrophosphatase (non-canonical NTP hydrolase)